MGTITEGCEAAVRRPGLNMNLETGKLMRFKSHYLVVFVLVALTAAALLERRNGKWEDLPGGIEEERVTRHNDSNQGFKLNSQDSDRCNLFSGRWVFDNISYPLYEEGRCSFMRREFACQTNGRKDTKYQNWRWQPHGCDLPRFDGAALLEKLRGKKMIFVGDSLNRNQWTSLLCLIEPSLYQATPKLVSREGNLYSFHAAEYNVTIGFYWSPLLVESNCDDPETHGVRDRVVRIEAIEKHARHWTDADILVFDSFAWWLEPTMTFLWGSFDSSDAIMKTVGMKLRRYEMGLNTWSDWLETNVDRARTHLFFMSLSPMHFVGESWEDTSGCYNVTDPIMKSGYQGIQTDPEMISIVQSALERLGTRGVSVEYLNITTLSDYRRDGHPSIYRNFSHPPAPSDDPKTYSDCGHWCLPGVPDVWNQILYSYILNLP